MFIKKAPLWMFDRVLSMSQVRPANSAYSLTKTKFLDR